ncbi:hypothetical protein GQX74_005349 [Glossina fuscipes]|nr:hypothetical protein GQX74_005349 [Glossina fuscipes]
MHTYSYTDFAGVAVESYNNLNFSITGISLVIRFVYFHKLISLRHCIMNESRRVCSLMRAWGRSYATANSTNVASEKAGSTTPSFGSSLIGRKSTATSQVAKRINARRLTASLVKIENWRRLIEQA